MKPFLLHSACLVAFCICMTVARAEEGTFQLKQTISLPGVEGRIDHFALDASGERLFVCALGNNTVEPSPEPAIHGWTRHCRRLNRDGLRRFAGADEMNTEWISICAAKTNQ